MTKSNKPTKDGNGTKGGRGKDGDIKLGFESEMIDLRLEQIVPLKMIPATIRTTEKYKRIIASIREVGIIEPPVVTPDGKAKNRYILLDGHIRLEVLKEMGEEEVACLISTDDESFTYNKHINPLSTIQEHRMILRAIQRGVPEIKIAQALNIDVSLVVRKRNLLEGICSEVVELLKDKILSPEVFVILRKMIPYRQIEVVELMNDSGIHSITYARAALAATPKEQLHEPQKPKKIKGMTDEQMDRMENEMGKLQRLYRLTEETYGKNVVTLTLAKGYLTTLLGNARIVRYLAQYHAGILQEFQKITETKALPSRDVSS